MKKWARWFEQILQIPLALTFWPVALIVGCKLVVWLAAVSWPVVAVIFTAWAMLAVVFGCSRAIK